MVKIFQVGPRCARAAYLIFNIHPKLFARLNLSVQDLLLS
jgi:hypothetical protein